MSSSRNNDSKTVFVLGAGFSREAGFPLQNEILDRVHRLEVMDVPPGALDKIVPDQASTPLGGS